MLFKRINCWFDGAANASSGGSSSATGLPPRHPGAPQRPQPQRGRDAGDDTYHDEPRAPSRGRQRQDDDGEITRRPSRDGGSRMPPRHRSDDGGPRDPTSGDRAPRVPPDDRDHFPQHDPDDGGLPPRRRRECDDYGDEPRRLPPRGHEPRRREPDEPRRLPPRGHEPRHREPDEPRRLPPRGHEPPRRAPDEPRRLPPRGHEPPRREPDEPRRLPPRGHEPPRREPDEPRRLPPRREAPREDSRSRQPRPGEPLPRSKRERLETIYRATAKVDAAARAQVDVLNNIKNQAKLVKHAIDRDVCPPQVFPYLYERLDGMRSVSGAAKAAVMASIRAYEGVRGQDVVYYAAHAAIDHVADDVCDTKGASEFLRKSIEQLERLSKRKPPCPCGCAEPSHAKEANAPQKRTKSRAA